MPARFTVRLTPSFQRDLDDLPPATQEKVLDALKRLEANPFGPVSYTHLTLPTKA